MNSRTLEPGGGTRGAATIYPAINIFGKNPYELRLDREKLRTTKNSKTKEIKENTDKSEKNCNPKKTKLQKQCDNMINTLEYVYSICFFIVFITLCIIMVASRGIYN